MIFWLVTHEKVTRSISFHLRLLTSHSQRAAPEPRTPYVSPSEILALTLLDTKHGVCVWHKFPGTLQSHKYWVEVVIYRLKRTRCLECNGVWLVGWWLDRPTGWGGVLTSLNILGLLVMLDKRLVTCCRESGGSVPSTPLIRARTWWYSLSLWHRDKKVSCAHIP